MQPLDKNVKPSIAAKYALDLLHEKGDVFEVRTPATRGMTKAGYFNDTTIAGAVIGRENGKHPAIYVTINPVIPSLIARSNNTFEVAKTTTTDSEILKRRWFPIDLDPRRPAHISSTDGELELARRKGAEIIDWLTSLGWPQPVQACSGNGWHVLYRIDLPNDPESRVLVEMSLKMLSGIFSDDKVEVDTTSFNASRVWKVYGTLSMKGSSTEERPHRTAFLASVPEDIQVVNPDLLDTMARAMRDSNAEEFKDMSGEFIGDMAKWLTDRGQTVTSGPRPIFGNEGQKWTISHCPFDHGHTNPMVALASNRPIFRCLHNSCSAFRWKEFREKIDPTYKDPETVYRRLKEWCEGNEAGVDGDLLQAANMLGKKAAAQLAKLKKEVPRARLAILTDEMTKSRREYLREAIGDNNEKGNLVGLINRTRLLQKDGQVPMYWTSDFDYRIRSGPVGDIECRHAGESDEISLLVRFHGSGDSWVKQTHCGQVIKHLAEEYTVNPLKQYLKSKVWDGVKRLDGWLSQYMGTKDDEYTRAVGRKWMISAVARAMDPGCQADHMLILEGSQGIGKSQALRILGGNFYVEFSGGLHSGTAQKDMVAVISGKMIVEMSELATLRRGDMESLKAMLTTPTDEARLSYERHARSYPRTCVFAGTTNEVGQSYIADTTGARRFWPVTCGERGQINSVGLRADADQLWAEAVEAYQDGEDWYSVPVELVAAEQMDRQVTVEDSDPWYTKIRNCLMDPDSFNEVFTLVPRFQSGQLTEDVTIRLNSMNSLLGIILGLDTARQSYTDVLRVRKSMVSIGFKKTRPSRAWNGSTYSYDLNREGIPHLWDSIIAASKKTPFPKTQEH